MHSALLAIALSFASPASAPVTTIDFSNDELLGGRPQSELEPFVVRKPSKLDRMVKYRASFRAEVLQSLR